MYVGRKMRTRKYGERLWMLLGQPLVYWVSKMGLFVAKKKPAGENLRAM